MARDSFQTSVNRYLAPGIKGGWASANPYVSLLPPNNGDLGAAFAASWRVGVAGAIVGQFAFADTLTGLVTSASPGTGPVFITGAGGQAGTIRIGFVQRDQMTLITTYLDGDAAVLFAGQPITLLNKGDVWAQFVAGAAVGAYVFANLLDGSAIAATTAAAIPTGAATTVTNTSGQATLTVTAGPIPPVGSVLTGTGVPTGAYVQSVAGSVVTMSANSTAAVTSVTGTTAVLTDFRVDNIAAAGDIAKISVWG